MKTKTLISLYTLTYLLAMKRRPPPLSGNRSEISHVRTRNALVLDWIDWNVRKIILPFCFFYIYTWLFVYTFLLLLAQSYNLAPPPLSALTIMLIYSQHRLIVYNNISRRSSDNWLFITTSHVVALTTDCLTVKWIIIRLLSLWDLY